MAFAIKEFTLMNQQAQQYNPVKDTVGLKSIDGGIVRIHTFILEAYMSSIPTTLLPLSK